jgi:fatty aldehyde-generating acyl-ACP reductase
MDTFGFIIHPFDTSDIAKKFPFLKRWRPEILEAMARKSPPILADHLRGIRSPYNQIEGWFVATPLTARQMAYLPLPFVLQKIIAAGKKLEKQGAKVIGLGAMTSVVGDAGITIAKHLQAPVTTGNSYTVATAIHALRKAAGLMGKELKKSHLVVVGATGAIGSICARIMAPDVGRITLAARNEQRLSELASLILRESGKVSEISNDVRNAVRRADLVITVSGSPDVLIHPSDLKPGTVVCDVARPRDVAHQVAEVRDDVLVIEGGLVEVPGSYESDLRFGLPHGIVYACMAETMILALEKRYECFTLGREITIEQVQEIDRLGEKHGFRLAGLRSYEKALSEEEIDEVRSRAQQEMERHKQTGSEAIHS